VGAPGHGPGYQRFQALFAGVGGHGAGGMGPGTSLKDGG
jgi:hypothetical protein